MAINEFEMNDPKISMGADVETRDESEQLRAKQLQLQMQSIQIERERPVNICVLEASLADL